jgi:hypothetical protein
VKIALGFRAHSGWAAMVAVGGTVGAPRILDRRRIVIADAELPGSRQPYHAAAGLPLAAAEALVRNAIESSRALALEALAAAVNSLRREGHEVAVCAVLFGAAKPLPPPESILASHALIHTAEGVMFRDVLAWAANRSQFRLECIREKELDAESLRKIGSLGRLIGPPWTQDQKFATVAALRALAAS